MNLKSRLVLRVAIVLPILAALLFIPAGSLKFWQGWVFLAIFAAFNATLASYFLKHDPNLLERRLKAREKNRDQKVFQIFWLPLWFFTLTLPGMDFRFHWSQAILGGSVPRWLSLAAQVLLGLSWLLIFQVFRFNTFASTVVEVEEGQRVITEGPYRRVRHPMYSALCLMSLSVPFALGSYVAVSVAALKIPLVIYRLRREEWLLRKDLPGYAEYCARTPWRLLPHVY